MQSCCLLLFFFGLLCRLTHGQPVLFQELSGTDWTAKDDLQQYKISAKVPGSIYSDLQTANKIGDIYKDLNDVNSRWVSQQNWTFEKYFLPDPSLFTKTQIFLTAHGLDTVGDVYLNNIFLGKVANQFVRYQWPVKSILQPGLQNHLVIRFRSAQQYALDQYLKHPYIVPPASVPLAQHGEPHANFIRKMQSSFSWDWGPAIPTQGIWKPIQLEAHNEYRLRDVTVQTMAPTKITQDRWTINVDAHLECIPSTSVQGWFQVEIGSDTYAMPNFHEHCNAQGEAKPRITLTMREDVKLWFPNGMGPQNLYTLKVTLRSFVGETQTSKPMKIGFRTVELSQQRLPSQLESNTFEFRMNGLPMWAKGSNWIPAHALQESITDAYLQDLLISAKLANMNMLRVWGGGVYESDRFYQLADELGILIWHDLMFACALYPVEKPFLDSVKTEVQQQIRRLQHHPSIALWAGNNENEVALVSPWWPEVLRNPSQYRDDYRKLYLEVIEPIVLREDPHRPYLASSPSNGIMEARENYTSSNPDDERFGDTHYYRVTGNVWDGKYPSAKFVSEFGFQSWSSLETLSKWISPDQLHYQYPLSSGMEHREHQTSGSNYLRSMIEQNLVLPTGNEKNAMEKYIFLSQIHQAMSVKLQTEFYRRNRDVTSEGKGHTMGALYWQLNDIWPTVSWSSIEFGGRWKMLHYYAQKMFDNVLVDAYLDEDQLKVALTRDTHDPAQIFDVTLTLYDFFGRISYQKIIPTVSHPFTSMTVFQSNLSSILAASTCRTRENCLVHVLAKNPKTGLEKDNFLLLAPPKNSMARGGFTILRTVHPAVEENGLSKFRIDFEAYNGVPTFVWLEMDPAYNIQGLFSENGFMLINKRSVWFQTLNARTTPQTVAQGLRVKTLQDYYQ